MRSPVLYAMFLALLLGHALALAVPDPVKADPAAYLDHALDLMQTEALRRNAVDWPKIRRQAHALAAHADTTA